MMRIFLVRNEELGVLSSKKIATISRSDFLN